MTHWYSKSQCTANVEKLKHFYNQVLDDFLEKLYKDSRFRTNGGLDETKIDLLGQQIKNFLKKPAHLFQKCIDMKEGSGRLEQTIKNQTANERYIPQLKIQHEDEKDNYLAIIPSKIKSHSRIDSKQKEDHYQQDYEDDLAEFVQGGPELPHKKSQKKDVEVKKEDNIIEYHVSKSQLKIEDEYSDSEAHDKNQLTIKECEQHLNGIFLGTFNANTIKHRPKEQKTSIQIDNVFVKWPANESYYGTISMETTKMEKDQIRREFPMRK